VYREEDGEYGTEKGRICIAGSRVLEAGLQLALDAGEVLLAGPVRFGPDVTHGFPDVSSGLVSLDPLGRRWRGRLT